MSRLEQEFEQQKLNQQEFGLRIDPPTGGLSKQGLGIEGVRSSTSYRPTGVAARRRPLFARTDLEREGYNTALPWLALSLIHHIPFPLTTFYEHTPTFVVHFTFAFTMRTSTSFAALVALMAVAGSAAPIGARTFPAPAPVPDNHSVSAHTLC
ncbi:hypothetical protein FRC12_020692 [Ceratobasidium sp. 428]|nr:hypothetical protein FRC12_020692 [Ceratobasidium sp. 428]